MIYAQRYSIRWRKSKDLLAAYIDRYNTGKPLGQQLRQAHRDLGEYLLYLNSAALQRHQACVGPLDPDKDKVLPRFLTNNAQLADHLGCSDRTVRNLRKRLRTAQVIVHEEFRGSNTSYELQLNPLVIHLQETAGPDNVIDHFIPAFQALRSAAGAPAQAPQKQAAGHGGRKTLPHTVTSLQKQDTKELISLSGVPPAKAIEDQGISLGSVLKTALGCEKPVEKPSRSPQPGSEQATGGVLGAGYETTATPTAGNTPPSCGAPPATNAFVVPEQAPDTLAAAVAHLAPELQVRLARLVSVLWACALQFLWPDKWLISSQIEKGKARLAEYFAYSDPARWERGADELMRRMALVRRWLDAARPPGARWIPLPEPYLDIRNQLNGFGRTKAWFKEDQAARWEIKNRELLTKALREYQRSHQAGAQTGPAEAYRRISQRLGKRDRALLDEFHALITDFPKQQPVAT